MIDFKLNGKKLKVASSWNDLTLKQYYDVVKTGADLANLISICSGIDADKIRNSSVEGLESVISALTFVKKAPDFTQYSDKCGPYKLPTNHKGKFNIQFESLA